MDELTDPAGIAALAACALALVALIVAAVAAVRLRRVRAAQQTVLGGEKTDLVAHAATLQEAFTALHERVEEVAARMEERVGGAEARLDHAITYRALVRYDAYGELSGHQSASLALLDAERNGVVLSSITHRETARLYCKQVVDGRGEHLLSPEEDEAIRRALAGERGSGGAGGLMRAAYLGPPGTNSHDALLASGADVEPVALPTVQAVVAAVQDGETELGLVPLENSREGAVGATLDALVFDAPDVVIVGEVVHRVTYVLVAAEQAWPDEVRTVHSHPQALGQCARFLDRAAAGRRARLRAVDGRRGARGDGGLAARARARTRRSGRATRPRSTARSCSPRASRTTRRTRRGSRWIARAGGAPGPVAGRARADGDRLLGRRRPRAGLARGLPHRALVARREPHADRVAAAPGGARALHVLLRPRRRRGRPGGRRGDRRRCGAHCERVRILGLVPAARVNGA